MTKTSNKKPSRQSLTSWAIVCLSCAPILFIIGFAIGSVDTFAADPQSDSSTTWAIIFKVAGGISLAVALFLFNWSREGKETP